MISLTHQMKDTIHNAAWITKPGKRYINRDTWLWNDDVELKVREMETSTTNFSTIKHRPIGKFIRMPTGMQRKQLLSSERNIKKIIIINWTLGMAKEICIDLLKAKPNVHFCCVNDKNGTLHNTRRAATDRWREYFEQISTEEFAHSRLPQSLPTFEAVPPVSATGAQRWR